MKKYSQVTISDVKEVFARHKYRSYDTNHLIDELMNSLWESADLDKIKAQQLEDEGEIETAEAYRHVSATRNEIAHDLFDLLDATGYFHRNEEE